MDAEIIDKLAFGAGIHQHSMNDPVNPDLNGWIVSPEKIDKFVELIVKECVVCAEREWICNGDTEHNRAVHGVIKSIKERFGVE